MCIEQAYKISPTDNDKVYYFTDLFVLKYFIYQIFTFSNLIKGNKDKGNKKSAIICNKFVNNTKPE